MHRLRSLLIPIALGSLIACGVDEQLFDFGVQRGGNPAGQHVDGGADRGGGVLSDVTVAKRSIDQGPPDERVVQCEPRAGHPNR